WVARHEKARELVDSLTPLSAIPDSGNPVDYFVKSKIEKGRAELQKTSHSLYGEGIKPLLEEHCFRCHGEKEKGELRLDDRDRARAGGESGYPAIVPGKAEKSQLLKLIQSESGDRMPPKGEGLREEQIALLEKWIADGADYGSKVDEAMLMWTPGADDLSFLRRVYLDTTGVTPTASEARTFLDNSDPGKRAAVIDELLADDRWADHWTSYWQDVLAENPNLLKPTLNNTGPFRWWIYDAMLDNKPMDRFVTELVTFQGSLHDGGAAGFKLAAENDVPMAAKAHIVSSAFLGVDMKCARCHDAPYHSSTQKDLFQLAANRLRGPSCS
ncbi:DUF1549 domain-containing protein, partial [Arenicella sp.]|nr:DUF1549 domain-containing protein [Arenicella sp.]